MVAFSSMATSKYLKQSDLAQDGNLVTIKGFKKENVAQQDEEPEFKYVVTFEEMDKPLVLNSTNRAILEKTFGPDTDDAIGKQIVLYVDENVSFGGKLTGGIRMRQRRTGKPIARPATQPQRQPGDDESDIPF